MTDWKKLVGKKVIVIDPMGKFILTKNYVEAKVVAVSPEGRVKFKWNTGRAYWHDWDTFDLVEVLK